ncbi:sushi domain-containing protein 2-like isoform X1 [Biomphalaria glabrata]|uniref:Sushi domain-containing protein 2-like isoform X1 n=1 Tax=Biomphalaria glabrata TaxID=6526 RepID=A0A9W3B9G5_BIOGL|nr:sushi domain-containing protein 2-like isoform X1 [Biomphalaria glabrata]XP_055896103.1 sushi domain-containing protein 2-like isoform X1 [Biomphalaria glabrata]XP_055896104.1 sushi domain-containing protein 2-like isoform X1 [Biomphalaria glabrata]XP_055896105.1 sushi domain-containing protein 2-like isoform X1 [Biomphalaria glabrata]XP_055896107.1 sushi domain-containing protein 2-like isoform X1 [Biomphalaria glabrata]XP_055896108.1 sushi domain-containing protein 2-like isoform X1 [Biom
MCACASSTHSVCPAKIHLATFNIFAPVLLLSLCTFLALKPAASVPVSQFFPYGLHVNDKMTERTDDGGSGRINLSIAFPFFGKPHNKLYVNNNGVISFFQELSIYKPAKFPLSDETPIIAAYWADVDISKSNGTVYYRETKDPVALTNASNEIKAYHYAYKHFRACWVFVATWDEVGYYGANNEGLQKKNTFQAVLVLDVTGRLSFVILNYAKIEWTTGANSRGNSTSGLGGEPAQVWKAGFNAGNKVNYYEINGANTDAVINLTQTSNTGIPGKWIFRIDSLEIENSCSHSGSGQVFFKPNFGSMLGGSIINVDGPCLNSTSTVHGRLESGAELCCYNFEDNAYCIFPPVFETGNVNVLMNFDERGWNYTGVFELKNVMDLSIQVTRLEPENWLTGQRVFVTWDVNSFNSSSYEIEILEYREHKNSTEMYSVWKESIQNINEGLYSVVIPPASMFSGLSVAIVRLSIPSLYCNGSGQAIYSDIFPVRYASQSDSEKVCSDWLSEQSLEPPLDVTGICPCTLKQAEGDTAQFSADPFCNENSFSPLNCLYRSHSASRCITPNLGSDSDPTFVCCYDKDSGELLNALEGKGGGTVERYRYYQRGTSGDHKIIPYFTYMQQDIAPYLHCCDFSSNHTLCNQFLQIKKPVECKGYAPPSAAQAAGDPHIETLDRFNYTFNGLGEFVLLREKNNSGALIQVRTSQATDALGAQQNATVFTAVAMMASPNSSILEIRAMDPNPYIYSIFVDKHSFELTSNTSKLNGFTIYSTDSSNSSVEFTVVIEQVGLSLLIQVTEEKLLNIMVIASSGLKDKLEGLLGNFNGNPQDDLMASNGILLSPFASMKDIHNEFGLSWEVSQNDSLFTELVSDNMSEQLDYTPTFADEIKITRNDTLKICGNNNQCKFDYEVTGKESIALSTKNFNERFEERINEIQPVTRCDYVPDIDNGNRTVTGLKVGDTITVECDQGYSSEGNSTVLICGPDGQWNSSMPSCVKVERIEPKGTLIDLVYIGIGAGAGGFILLVAIVVIIRAVCKRAHCMNQKMTDKSSDYDQALDLPTIFPISDIPTPVFENSLFMSSLQKLNQKGSFHIPRPTYVDPNIYSEYF